MELSWLMISSIVFLLLLSQSQSQSDTTVFNYTQYSQGDPTLIFQGDAFTYPAGRTTQLTDIDNRIYPGIPLPNSAGRIMYSPPIRLWDRAGRRQANFQTNFRCLMWNLRSVVMGDGISFFIAPVNTTIPAGSIAGHMGLYSPSSGFSPTPLLAVELDVFSNFWDPSYRHVGININSRHSVAVARWNVLTNANVVDVRITYDARQRLITVVASATANATLEHKFDLKTLLPEWVQIGISASTGGPGVVALHELRNWSFISFLVPDHDDVTDADH